MDRIFFSSLEQLLKLSGLQPTNCSCPVCQKKCSDTVCLGTPGDILRLIGAGFGSFLQERDIKIILVNREEVMIVKMLQLIKEKDGCVMFRDGKCLLHNLGLKPSEGRYYIHPQDERDAAIMDLLCLTVALEWVRKDNIPEIIRCFVKPGD